MSWASNHPSEGGISLGFKLGGKDARQQEEEDQKLFKELLDQGYPKDAAAYLVKQSRDTGKLVTDLPNYQNAMLNDNSPDRAMATPNRPVDLPPAADIPQRSTLRDFLPMQHEAIATMDASNPKNIDFLPVPSGVSNVKSIVQYNKPTKEVDPRVAAAQSVFKKYLSDASSGFVSPEMYQMLPSAAQYLGLSTEETPTPDNPMPQGFFEKAFGAPAQNQPKGPPSRVPVFPNKGTTPATAGNSQQGMIAPGNIDLTNRPRVNNPDGSYSTVRTITVDMDGKTILLPTVVNGKIVSPDQAVQHYKQTGEHMGIFKDQQSADAYDKQLHENNGWTGPANKWPSTPGQPAPKTDLTQAATDWLKAKGAPVTEANIQAVIKAGKVK